MVPAIRIRALVDRPARTQASFVLYWMTAFRRLESNFALDRALEWCEAPKRPLVILEALRCDYPWASDRIHRFVLQGMAANRRRALRPGFTYYPYVEPKRGAGRGLLRALSAHASVIVTDDYPCFFLPRMQAAAAIVPRGSGKLQRWNSARLYDSLSPCRPGARA